MIQLAGEEEGGVLPRTGSSIFFYDPANGIAIKEVRGDERTG
jgi:hypothetical protein